MMSLFNNHKPASGLDPPLYLSIWVRQMILSIAAVTVLGLAAYLGLSDAEKRFNSGTELMDEGRHEEAIAEQRTGSLSSAIKAYIRSIELDPELALASQNRASAHLEPGDRQSALADLERSLELDNQSAAAQTQLVWSFWTWAKVKRRSLPWTAPSNWILSFSQPTAGPERFSWPWLTTAKQSNSTPLTAWPTAIVARPTCCAGNWNWPSLTWTAPLSWTQVIQPHTSAVGWSGDITLAVDDYTLAIMVDPTSLNAYLNQGSAYGRLGRYAEAVIDYGNALHLALDSPTLYTNRWASFHAQDDLQRALADFEKRSPLTRLPPRPGTT